MENKITPTVGMEAVVFSWGNPIFGYKVIKVTPTGQVTAQRGDGHTMRFNADGMQMGTGSSKYHTPFIQFNVQEVREQQAAAKRRAVAANAIMAVRVERCLPTYLPESMIQQIAELEELLAKAKAAVEAL